ncbi:MAG TPA: pilus assembly protein TadG-related protein [Bryobacteraceae bacterium]|jgi:Flp pilus assembly protein TadG|nr:pilus assembly protein TadG-related protein [Bryobacteraceae bacterium]
MKTRKRQAERGIAVIATTIMLVILIPVIGLAIDVTLLYVDKARLQGAADGAALAGAESLARGTNDAAQQTSARQAAAEYVFLNYPTTFFFTNSITVNQATDITIDESVANQRTVGVTAHANVPTLFMRWLNFTSTNVNASATVTRRDVNIVVVMDRSGSLASSGSCAAVQQAAINFVNKFSNGSDNLGLVTFGASTHVDFPIANNFLGASGTLPAPASTVPTLIGNITCQSSTSSAMALWYGYDQLVGLNQPTALNVILFFTDGKPTGVNVNMPIAPGSTCTGAHAATASIPWKYINGLYNTYTNQDEFFGLSDPINTGYANSADSGQTTDGNNSANCGYMGGTGGNNYSGNQTVTSDFLGVPEIDVFGDKMVAGYGANSAYLTPVTTVSSGSNTFIALNNTTNADYMAENAADYAAQAIRAGVVEPTSATGLLSNIGKGLSSVVIYTVGLGNAPYPLSVPLLQRISNVAASPIYVAPPTEQQGDFILAPTSADINAAFATIAAEILRIAK